MRALISSLLLLLLAATPAHAWSLRVGRLQSAGVDVRSLAVSRTADRLVASADTLKIAALDVAQSRLELACTLTRPTADSRHCQGDIGAASPAWRGSLLAAHSEQRSTLRMDIDGGWVQWQQEALPEAPAKLTLHAVPLSWVKSRLKAAWPALASLSGRVDARLDVAAGGTGLAGDIALQGLAFDSESGELAGSALQLRGPLDVRFGTRASARLQLRAPRGQLLFGPVYFQLPESDSVLRVVLEQDAAGQWQAPVLAWDDQQGLAVEAALHAVQDAAPSLRVATIDMQLAPVVDRYLRTALAAAGFDGLQVSGTARGSGRYEDGRWQALDLQIEDAAISDPQQRIEVAGLGANLHIAADAPDNRMLWRGLKIYRIAFGDGQAQWQWRPDSLRLSEPLVLDVLGGKLRVPRLERQPIDSGAQWQGELALQGIDMLALSTALDWPHFAGTLSGVLPGFVYRDGGFTTEGDLQLRVFDGSMRVSHLSSERSFGVAPTVGADVEFDNLDLEQVSAAMDFGAVQGWLDGEVRGLRLLDWAPMAFDAQLRTDPDYPHKQRISQRAVQGLSSVGGGGSAAGNPMMKLFDSFPYAQIGLSCRLVDNVCAMGGLDEIAGGYTILRGSGLPRLTVIGHQRHVDWPVLLDRLGAVSAGQAPVIE